MIDDAKPVLQEDPVMAELLDEHDPTPRRTGPSSSASASPSSTSELSTASAAAVKERVFDLLENDVTPESVLAADEDALSEAGLSGMKIEYVRNAAEAFQETDLTREGLADHTPPRR